MTDLDPELVALFGPAAAFLCCPIRWYETLDDDATHTSPVFDTRGHGALTVTVEIDALNRPIAGGDGLHVVVMTRRAGRPWIGARIWDIQNGDESGLTELPIFAGVNAFIRSTAHVMAYGLLDEAQVLIVPRAGGATSGLTDDGNGNIWDLGAGFNNDLGDWGDGWSVEYVDPGAPNETGRLESVDGRALRVIAGTDNVGAVTMTLGDINGLLLEGMGSALLFTVNNDGPIAPLAPFLLTRGANNSGGGDVLAITGTVTVSG